MSTRAFIKIYNEDREPICGIYQHGDGYVSGLGAELAMWLYGREITRGIWYGSDGKREGSPKQNNGMDCLAAELVSYLKVGRERNAKYGVSGVVYLYPQSWWSDADAAYFYDIYIDRVLVREHSRVIFSAPWDAMVQFSEQYKPAE